MENKGLIFLVVILLVFGRTGMIAAQDAPFSESHGPSVGEMAGRPDSSADNSPDTDVAADDSLDDEWEDDYLADEDEVPMAVSDPLKPWNTVMYHFNDKLYFWMLKPVSQGYGYVVPEIVRRGILNFFINLEMPVQFVNCLLQGRGHEAEAAAARFVVNSSIGVLGFGNPADDVPKLKQTEEDLGQTFGRWGIGNGWYLVLPFFGPTTVRDGIGMVGDMFLNPTFYIDSIGVATSVGALDKINRTSFKIGDYETIKEAAFDPYIAIRDGYIQYRTNKVNE